MNLVLVYDKNDQKLRDEAYSSVFKGQFNALVNSRFDTVQGCNDSCSAKDIDADVILFYDVHSSHHIQIDGIEKHKALKLEYYSDPHQRELHGQYQDTGVVVHKLGAEQRIHRSLDRGVSHIISPVKERFLMYFEPYLNGTCEKMLWHFPLAPSFEPKMTELIDRDRCVLGNGATWDGGIGAYKFREWAFKQDYIHEVQHWIQNKSTPCGQNYGNFLSGFAGGLAASEFYPVPKYYEMPLAGMVTFTQHHKEYEELGFKDFKHCIYVNETNIKDRINAFLDSFKSDKIKRYQRIANAGRRLVAGKYTAEHFADFIYKKCVEEIQV